MMGNSLGFLALNSRYVIEGDLIPQAALHIGSGSGDSETDATFIRDTYGPFIPGSSLRGVMRSTLERILQAVGGDRGCVLFAEHSHPRCFTVNSKKLEDFDAWLSKQPVSKREIELTKKLLEGDGLCDVCKLFGSPLLASKLRVSDSRPVAGAVPQMVIRDGVAMDRDTETAREKFKFDFQALEKGLTFEFRLDIENAIGTDLALVHILLTQMKNGIDVGGKKACGLGRCTVDVKSVEYFDAARGYGVDKFLSTGKLARMTGQEFEAITSACLSAYLKQEGTTHAAASGE